MTELSKTLHFTALSASISLSKPWSRPQNFCLQRKKSRNKLRLQITQKKMSCGKSSFYIPQHLLSRCILFHAVLIAINQQFYSLFDDWPVLPKVKSSVKQKLQQLRTRSQMWMRQSEKWLWSLANQEILDAGDAEQGGHSKANRASYSK